MSGAVPTSCGYEQPDRPCVYYANHASHLDAVVLWASLPPERRAAARPVAARDYWAPDAFRRYLATRVFRAVLVDRGVGESAIAVAERGRQAIAAMTEALDAGDSLILFPEGTRGDGRTIAPFRSGLYHLAAARPGLPLVPVRIHNLNRVLPKGEVLPVPVLSRVIFGPTVTLAPGERKAEFLERARAALLALPQET